MKHTIPKLNKAEWTARKTAKAKVTADIAAANNVPALRAAVQELLKAAGMSPAAAK